MTRTEFFHLFSLGAGGGRHPELTVTAVLGVADRLEFFGGLTDKLGKESQNQETYT